MRSVEDARGVVYALIEKHDYYVPGPGDAIDSIVWVTLAALTDEVRERRLADRS